MAGKKRSGLINDARTYGRSSYYPPKKLLQSIPPNYTVIYNGNTNTSGYVPTDGSSPYTSGLTVTVLGNSGSPVLSKSGFTFSGWNTRANGLGTSYSQGHKFTIDSNIILYAVWTPIPPPPAPTALSSVGGNAKAYILFTQSGTMTNYQYSTDNGVTFLSFEPQQIYSPLTIMTLSTGGGQTPLTNGTTYTIKLKAISSGLLSSDSESVTVTPTITSLLTTNHIIYLDANNPDSYTGSGNNWTNLVSGGAYSATLNGSPAFDTSTESNKYFKFNEGIDLTGQYALINQSAAINPVINTPFTIQMWAKINNVGAQGSLIGKMFDQTNGNNYNGYSFMYRSNNALQLHLIGETYDNTFQSITGILTGGWALYTANIQFGNGGGRKNKLFVNGRQVLTATSDETGIPHPEQNLTFSTGFGGEGECDIGQFYYYNAELTTTQIIQNFDATRSTYEN
jgi:uncharacterized repeat protein (TIGR02543 family)